MLIYQENKKGDDHYGEQGSQRAVFVGNDVAGDLIRFPLCLCMFLKYHGVRDRYEADWQIQ